MEYHSLTYREETTAAISFKNVIEHLKTKIPKVTIINKDIYGTICFNIHLPAKSVNKVLYSCKISENQFFFHQVNLHYPCSIIDLKIFNCLTLWFQNQYNINEHAFIYGMHNHYNKYFYSKIEELLNSTNITIAWQNLMNSAFKNDKNNYIFSVSNQVLIFNLSANFLKVDCNDKNFNQNIIAATLKYIWNINFLEVNTNNQFILIKSKNNKIRDRHIQAIVWQNTATQLLYIYCYLLLKINNEWVAIKPKHWLPILMPLLHQYDANNVRQLLPVLSSDCYNQIVAKLLLHPTNLKFSYAEIDNDNSLFATIKNFKSKA